MIRANRAASRTRYKVIALTIAGVCLLAVALTLILPPAETLAGPHSAAHAAQKSVPANHATIPWTEPEKRAMADRVRNEFVFAWNNYKQYALGHDELNPLSKTPHDWYGVSLYMTPVDALDTMILMGLGTEAASDRELIARSLSFDQDISVKNFEITIRMLGGLLSSYELSKDKRLLALAEDLGDRLLPVFDSPTGMPYVFVNLRTGAVRDAITNPAEIGTLLLEFGALSKLTGKKVFYDKAKRALTELYKRRSSIDLVGSVINIVTGEWTNPSSNVSGGIDSYYEYLLKCGILFGDMDCKKMWGASILALNKYVADEAPNGLWYGTVDMNTGARIAPHWGALDAYFAGSLALSGDLRRAERLQDSSDKMWMIADIEPEEIDYSTMKITSPAYPLRPEIIESTFYLYRLTQNPRYLDMGRTYFEDIVKYCRTENGYAELSNVETKEKSDRMPSYFLAETLKYFYLLYAPEKTLDLNKEVFNTDAHPLHK
jgi:mannosidase alpha-like ER degradation enhancer 2